MVRMTNIEYIGDIESYAMFDRVARRELKMTGEEFLVLYRAGVYDSAGVDEWEWVDTYFMLWNRQFEWEPAFLDHNQFMNEVLCDRIDEWHFGMGEGQELHEYLGWTLEEYAQWINKYDLPKVFTDQFMEWDK